ncbi:uncharacterized protein BXZ73DRAFT_96653 [Epithele typhae]|uniref:uncharacterized protein n=1 Tax=Epithele typhae TaxID=378194 RepID=UPI0020087957|nr:uncharacterized protein BXZ73DRAFT_96653 [Epithele typhae]KAH9944158.1 hypothetical protein BXZ73DRAFT_96653 [Epithele typhae]
MASTSSETHLRAPAPHLSPTPPTDRATRLVLPPAPDRAADGARHDSPVAAAVASPHDAVLADLLAGGPGSRDVPGHARPEGLRSAPRLGVLAGAPSVSRTASPSAGARSAASSPGGAAHEPLFDPFSGAPVGVVVPKRHDEHESAPGPSPQFDRRRDELWARLASIRELQSDVAGLHVQMEGIGLGDGGRGGKRAPGAGVGRVHSDTIPVAGDEWGVDDDGDGAEGAEKRARGAEFTNLAETFKGRREAIDAIMGKLGELSDALTTRNATKDSMLASPDLAIATSPASTVASPSPEFTSSIPKFVLTHEADRGVIHDSPISASGELSNGHPHGTPSL